MTSIEWLEEKFQMYLSWHEGHHSAKEYKLEDFAKDFQQAKEMHKQEMATNCSQLEISDESWEGCDGCTEQDEVMYKNGYVKGYNAAIAKEISDEEIEKAKESAWSDYEYQEGNLYSTTFKGGWDLAIKWYREQLKQKL